MEMNVLEMEKEEKQLHDICKNDLDSIWKNKAFIKEYEGYIRYYLLKIRRFMASRSDWEDVANEFYYFVADLFYQGYFIGLQMKMKPEIEIQDVFYEQPDGLLREQVFDILSGATTDINRVVSHIDNMSYIDRMKTFNDELVPVLEQIKITTACYGCYHFFKNERKKRQLAIREEPNAPQNGILHRSDDLLFISPEKYLVCLNTDSQTEIWTLNYWNGINTKFREIGIVKVSYFSEETISKNYEILPYYQGLESIKANKPKYLIDITCKEKIQDYEKQIILTALFDNIANRQNTKNENIHFSIAITPEIEYFQHEKKDN